MECSSSIQIYNGNGTSPVCVAAWKRELQHQTDPRFYKIDTFRKDEGRLDTQNTSLIVVPGGNAFNMIPEIASLARQINEAVNNRSGYLGSCAGTLLCSSIVKSQRIVNDFTQQTLLSFNPISTLVPYYLPSSNVFTDPKNKCAIEVEWHPTQGNFRTRTCKLYHAIGPAFTLSYIAKADVYRTRILASYNTPCSNYNKANLDLENQPPAAAILYQPNSTASKRLFTGVHPEIGLEDLAKDEFTRQFDETNCHYIKTLEDELSNNEQIRKEMCRSWLSELGIRLQF